jgi:glutamate carboxypeptidase
VKGKASHAGVDFEAGASAVLELARQIDHMAGFARFERGITVNPGVISGGTRANVVAAEAHVDVDIRVPRLRDAAALEEKFRGLTPFDHRCTLEVTGGLNRPPMERSPGIVALFRKARKLAQAVGVQLEESATGGGSDGNFTAALGIPTLDGLGAVGEGAHAPNESILVDRMADRTALMAKLLGAL